MANNCRQNLQTIYSNSDDLYALTLFIVCYYGPMWFEMKKRAWCTDGAIHLLQMIKLLKKLPPSIRAVVWPVVQRNAYWAHPKTFYWQCSLIQIVKIGKQLLTSSRLSDYIHQNIHSTSENFEFQRFHRMHNTWKIFSQQCRSWEWSHQ